MTTQTKMQPTKCGEEHIEHTRTIPVERPDTDIIEREGSIVLLADMSGVDEQHVDIELENNVLSIAGYRSLMEEKDHELLYRGYTDADYRRAFTLGEEVDREGIQATMKNGVLRIELPKSKEMQPRKIKVNTSDQPAE